MGQRRVDLRGARAADRATPRRPTDTGTPCRRVNVDGTNARVFTQRRLAYVVTNVQHRRARARGSRRRQQRATRARSRSRSSTCRRATPCCAARSQLPDPTTVGLVRLGLVGLLVVRLVRRRRGGAGGGDVLAFRRWEPVYDAQRQLPRREQRALRRRPGEPRRAEHRVDASSPTIPTAGGATCASSATRCTRRTTSGSTHPTIGTVNRAGREVLRRRDRSVGSSATRASAPRSTCPASLVGGTRRRSERSSTRSTTAGTRTTIAERRLRRAAASTATRRRSCRTRRSTAGSARRSSRARTRTCRAEQYGRTATATPSHVELHALDLTDRVAPGRPRVDGEDGLGLAARRRGRPRARHSGWGHERRRHLPARRRQPRRSSSSPCARAAGGLNGVVAPGLRRCSCRAATGACSRCSFSSGGSGRALRMMRACGRATRRGTRRS